VLTCDAGLVNALAPSLATAPTQRRTARSVLRRFAELVVGAAAGLVAGPGLVSDLDEGEHGTDLLPPPGDWSVLHWLVAVSWLAGYRVAWTSPRLRWIAVGWCIGVPILLGIALVYTWVVFGQWGYSPLPDRR
jgi:hypothetical protein